MKEGAQQHLCVSIRESDYPKPQGLFLTVCSKHGIEPTKRQWIKWCNKRGLAYGKRNEA